MANDSKRTEQVKINLTERELLDLKRLASAEDRAVADFIRSSLRAMLYGSLERLETGLSGPRIEAVSELLHAVSRKRISRRRREVFAVSDGRCFYCSTPITLEGDWHADHRMPKALDDSDELPNLVAACAPCNLAKRDTTDIEFRARRAAVKS